MSCQPIVSVAYIRRLAEANRLAITTRDKIGLRIEHHHWVNGDLFLLGRPADRRPPHRWWRVWREAKD